ncbi:MAG: DUF5510 family protein [Rickettsia conorii subsp. raoultii]|uniref:DUF5510 family protein n=2 Tax=spotted fever group TaxID=114277 RepID=A0A9N7B7L9_RICCR|nr:MULTISPECIES: DUF5510 family protein [Rickettsia]KJV81511.1 putative membrane protein [Rickettsia hoogstraalii str. RCCE3]MCC8407118.1 DUF5510 family protein [Rickettsia endosymbiont of Sceptobius lativentris]MCC8462452.1 DUF5510 family protein [Rickettsia endosymbiont of Ecitomorpha arachnoides]AJQ51462.1 hypothetical protein UQ52_00745 [Rickettsia conorii subsp. raoultii]MCX4084487.1 DUF5510 family protein [Rickettsia hoogstraalii]
MFKNLLCIIIFLGINLNVYAINSSSYTTDDIIKIVIILGIVILIFSPAKFRIIVIGTMLGLACAYFTYKYIVPIFISSLNGP